MRKNHGRIVRTIILVIVTIGVVSFYPIYRHFQVNKRIQESNKYMPSTEHEPEVEVAQEVQNDEPNNDDSNRKVSEIERTVRDICHEYNLQQELGSRASLISIHQLAKRADSLGFFDNEYMQEFNLSESYLSTLEELKQYL